MLLHYLYRANKIVQGRPCEVQEVSTRGTSGGGFFLTYEGEKTREIPWNATAGELQTAMEVRK